MWNEDIVDAVTKTLIDTIGKAGTRERGCADIWCRTLCGLQIAQILQPLADHLFFLRGVAGRLDPFDAA